MKLHTLCISALLALASAGAGAVDARGVSWIVDGDLDVLRIEISDGRLRSDEYPDALARVWAALPSPSTMISASTASGHTISPG